MSLPMLTRIKAQNLLSFGPEGIDLELPALTVLIGPNGSGKSNLLETVGLLRAAPQDIGSLVQGAGGVRNWIWKGSSDHSSPASIGVDILGPFFSHHMTHVVQIAELVQLSTVSGEYIRCPLGTVDGEHRERVWERHWNLAKRRLMVNEEENELDERTISINRSILSEVKDALEFPELHALTSFYEGISLYRQWEFGPRSAIRQPQRIDVRPSPLMEDFSNLGMFLNRFRQHPQPKMELFDRLGDLYAGLRDFELNIEGGTVQIFFTEGEFSIPATRLSDGSLRYLCLLAILLDPEPPSLVCIEEPELGFHPDLIPKLADLLIDASSRCQVIVTTHSDILVDALHDHPEAVVVCEKHDGQTSMRRLDRSDLAIWLEKYRLGELWTRGQLGGVRW